jgi:hypothetical protein
MAARPMIDTAAHNAHWVSHQPALIQSSDRVPAIVQRLPDFSLLGNLSNLLSLNIRRLAKCNPL